MNSNTAAHITNRMPIDIDVGKTTLDVFIKEWNIVQ